MPNVLIVLVGAMGFGASSAYGGPCGMPTAQRLAHGGLQYTGFRTSGSGTATRNALLTGRGPASGGIRHHPGSATTIATILRYHGYRTAAFGKVCRPGHPQQPSALEHGGFQGFEKFYGFAGTETSQWEPILYDGTRPATPLTGPQYGYHLSEDLTDQAIHWIRVHKARTPGTPFFAYLAFGATQAPHHVPRRWRDQYRGLFHDGWDMQRQRTLRRQQARGIVPAHTELVPRPHEIPAWSGLSQPAKQVALTLMENYAGFATHTDRQVGRIVDALNLLGTLDDTLVFYVLGDGPASRQGGPHGTINDVLVRNGVPEPALDALPFLDDVGGPESNPGYPAGWALAMDTPFDGGTRNGLIVHWPDGIKERGRLCHQRLHCTDILPTILEAAGLPEPYTVDGVAQRPIEGAGMRYTFGDPDAPDRRGGLVEWPAVRVPAQDGGEPSYPSSITVYSGMQQVPSDGVPDVKNTSHTIVADIEVGVDGGDGVVAAQGGRFGGWALYLRSGLVTYCYNLFGRERTYLRAPSWLRPGRHAIRYAFAYDGGGIGKGGIGTLTVDDIEIGAVRIDATVPLLFADDQALGIGRDSGSPVTGEYAGCGGPFTGTIRSVRIDIGRPPAQPREYGVLSRHQKTPPQKTPQR
ncbi:hypothetical protein GCM10022419_115210 [Nonomuraea rosea]|uniref:Sulfatase N-terminal domain-containing protein n=1 Tax=Nonomuraea rosea TaxID=638574 RepID=A0ABP6ZJC0_9ACTN